MQTDFDRMVEWIASAPLIEKLFVLLWIVLLVGGLVCGFDMARR